MKNSIIVFLVSVLLLTLSCGGPSPDIQGTLTVWHPMTLNFEGPETEELSHDPNPFLDYRLQVLFTGPGGQIYDVPGYYAGDGKGQGTGNIWQVIFAPDQAGTWTFEAQFRRGKEIAIQLDPNAGEPVMFDGVSGNLVIAPLDEQADGFLKWGRLEYVGKHYLKFPDGSYWIKGGTDSPENFLGYSGFDHTVDQGGKPDGAPFLHDYSFHVRHWQKGDPDWNNGAGKGIIGALNYLASQEVNSIYFLPMNLGGDGQETFPFVQAEKTHFNKTHYDISKLYQWGIVLDHAQNKGIKCHVVLAETEKPNETWLDDGNLGIERKLFFRELVARFGHLLALKWNLSEENDFTVEQLREQAAYIQAVDPYNHPICVHTHPNNFQDYQEIVGNEMFTTTSIQYKPDLAAEHVREWRQKSAQAGLPWVLDMDENNPAGTGLTDKNADDLRKRVLYDVYFNGGEIEWYCGYHARPPENIGGDLTLEDFRTREAMWTFMRFARRFIQEHLPFWEMQPMPALLSGESDAFDGGSVFAKPGEIYAVYLPQADPSGILDLSDASGELQCRWFNPRTGEFQGPARTLQAGSAIELGAPPDEPKEDWVVLIKKD
jgi:hypothetical protein